ncbi:glycosyltransferase [Paenibacillus sp. LMG 31459]|uniref:Glycosyltransferase n=1 Tax=Paenibacillus phytohabitans TaxID=2654978 RepID=A0ABX1YE30_9BACL|nr:glycosyltransferase [Paenibacillus phytohabitans]NOU79230.1 glycosyltransferase [Paenibacillus phytohabitans]
MNKTSIVILTYNKLEFTIDCIESIRNYTTVGTYEIIVIDNASTDGSREWLSDQSDIITIFNNENYGFPKGCNQGIEVATGDNILLLNNDVIVTTHWLDNLLLALNSSAEVGAVGAISNECAYYQSISVNYKNIEEMQEFAKNINIHNPHEWDQRIKLVGFCMLIKREVINEIGLLDEIFSPGNFEDDDYSFRIMKAGYKLLLCKDTFVHHHGHATFSANSKSFHNILHQSAARFKEKWAFDSRYSTHIRFDVIDFMELPRSDIPINVLEVGCACGGTLLEIKNRYKNAELHGIELNEDSAAIASLFAKISASNVEHTLEYQENYFDYIILPDVLEHLNDPWSVLKNLKRYLKDNGKVIASIPNVMHYSLLRDTLQGRWEYADAGLLDRTHLRFFTIYEIEKMFDDAGFMDMNYKGNVIPIPEGDEEFISKLASLGSSSVEQQYRVYQWLVKAERNDLIENLGGLIKRMDITSQQEMDLSEIISLIKNNSIEPLEIIKLVEGNAQKKQTTYNYLAIGLYKERMFDHIIPLLSQSLNINSQHTETLYNLGFILYEANEKELALEYLHRIADKDEDTQELINEITLN